ERNKAPKNRTKTKRYLEEVDKSFRMKIREVWHNEMREQRRNIFFFDWYENSQIIYFEEFFKTQKKGKGDIRGKNCFPESTYEKSIENNFLGYLVEQQKTQDLSPKQQDSKTIPMEPIILRSHEEPSSHSQFEVFIPQSETYLLPYSYPITTILIPTATPKDKVAKFFGIPNNFPNTNDQMSNSLTRIQASSYDKLTLQKEVSSFYNKIDSSVNKNLESYITRIINTSFYNIINDPKGITRSKFRLFHNVLFSKIYIQPNPNKTLCYHSQTKNSFERKSQNQISAEALCTNNEILVHKRDLFGSIFVISDTNQFGTFNPEEERTKRKLKINDLFQEQNCTKKELRDLKGKIRSLELQNNSCMGQDEEVVNSINSYVKQKWYAEVRYKFNDGFQFSYKTLIDSGADVNCIREDLAKDRKILTKRLKKKPPAWTAKHTQAVKKIKGNIIPRTPTVQEKYGNNSSYILNIEEVILPLEFGDSDLNIIKIMGKYFPQHQYFIPEYPGKDQNYYETILCETRSAQIFHTRNGDGIGIHKIIDPKNYKYR
uniref:Peptidase A2 domain-containing protein n=1 Tax=Oryza glaberrima TaxID=4538 RepID=I1PVM3_ORYGL